jgi:imidazoleglycerol-phosphate dehydratase
MKIAFILYDGITALDFVGVFDAFTHMATMGLVPEVAWDLCAQSPEIVTTGGMRIMATRSGQPLEGYDVLVVPGGSGSRRFLLQDPEAVTFIQWIQTARDVPLKTSVCTGALVLGAAGFLQGKPATTHPSAYEDLAPLCSRVLKQRIVDAGDVITAGGVTSSIDLGLYLVEKFSGEQGRLAVQKQIAYSAYLQPEPVEDPSSNHAPRTAHYQRRTQETEIDIRLTLDGSGSYQIDTGIGFFDHMLSHLAVHGLFDLDIQAKGDLHVDMHHTVEDVALAVGEAFRQALGDRQGIVRMASAYVPMDEALALVAVDLSGRPYTSFEGSWHSPQVGGIPTTLFQHFLESFATNARCNLHARLISGRDDHHQAEALFKALARALDAATSLDARRTGAIPSTKGTLIG